MNAYFINVNCKICFKIYLVSVQSLFLVSSRVLSMSNVSKPSRRIQQIQNTKHNVNRYFKLIDSLNHKVQKQNTTNKNQKPIKVDDILHRFRIKTEDIQLDTKHKDANKPTTLKVSKNSLRNEFNTDDKRAYSTIQGGQSAGITRQQSYSKSQKLPYLRKNTRYDSNKQQGPKRALISIQKKQCPSPSVPIPRTTSKLSKFNTRVQSRTEGNDDHLNSRSSSLNRSRLNKLYFKKVEGKASGNLLQFCKMKPTERYFSKLQNVRMAEKLIMVEPTLSTKRSEQKKFWKQHRNYKNSISHSTLMRETSKSNRSSCSKLGHLRNRSEWQ